MTGIVGLEASRRLWACGWRPGPSPYLFWGQWSSGDWTVECSDREAPPLEPCDDGAPTCTVLDALTFLDREKGVRWAHYSYEQCWYYLGVRYETPDALLDAALTGIEAEEGRG